MKTIPIIDLNPEVEELKFKILEQLGKVIDSTHFILGPQVQAFEKQMSQYLKVPHAVGLNSGTDALVIALRSLGVGPGDEVIVPSFTFFATAEVVSLVGATPVFADVDIKTWVVTVDDLEKVRTAKTKAVIPVHLFGNAVDMNLVSAWALKNKIEIIEDVAQAMGGEFAGEKLGSFGKVSAFSFYPTKNLGAYGDGGLLVTKDAKVLEQALKLRNHGSIIRYQNEVLGYNSRLDEFQAAVLRVKFEYLDRWNEMRRVVAGRYNELLMKCTDVVLPVETQNSKHVYHQYTVRILNGRRDNVAAKLKALGVGTMVYYPVPVHELPVYAGSCKNFLPVTEQLSGEVLSLPIWPQMSIEDQVAVSDALWKSLG